MRLRPQEPARALEQGWLAWAVRASSRPQELEPELALQVSAEPPQVQAEGLQAWAELRGVLAREPEARSVSRGSVPPLREQVLAWELPVQEPELARVRQERGRVSSQQEPELEPVPTWSGKHLRQGAGGRCW